MTNSSNSNFFNSSNDNFNKSTFLFKLTLFLLYQVLPYAISYFVPVGYLISIINNFLVILILAKHKQVSERTSKSIRIYYSMLAFCDMSYSSSTALVYFLGKRKL